MVDEEKFLDVGDSRFDSVVCGRVLVELGEISLERQENAGGGNAGERGGR